MLLVAAIKSHCPIRAASLSLIVTLWLCQQFAIENGPVEIVDLPIDSMVIFNSYVKLPEGSLCLRLILLSYESLWPGWMSLVYDTQFWPCHYYHVPFFWVLGVAVSPWTHQFWDHDPWAVFKPLLVDDSGELYYPLLISDYGDPLGEILFSSI